MALNCSWQWNFSCFLALLLYHWPSIKMTEKLAWVKWILFALCAKNNQSSLCFLLWAKNRAAVNGKKSTHWDKKLNFVAYLSYAQWNFFIPGTFWKTFKKHKRSLKVSENCFKNTEIYSELTTVPNYIFWLSMKGFAWWWSVDKILACFSNETRIWIEYFWLQKWFFSRLIFHGFWGFGWKMRNVKHHRRLAQVRFFPLSKLEVVII